MRHGGSAGRTPGWRMLVAAALLVAVRAGAVDLGSTFGRWSAGGYAEGYGILRQNHDSRGQLPAGILDLTLTGEPHRSVRLFLDARTTFGGTPKHADGVGLMNLSDTFQNISPFVEIEEGYLDLFLPSLDVRLGKQKFAWGKLDTFQPTDVVNPKRYTDPFVIEEQDAKIGVPALRASYFVPDLGPRFPTEANLTLVWVPVPVPARFPLTDERWFPSAINLASELHVPGSVFESSSLPRLSDLTVRTTLATENARPPQQLDEGAVGLRLSGLSGRTDWALYYYDGSETQPAFAFKTSVRASNPAGFGTCLVVGPGPCDLNANAVLRPIFGRIRLGGGDAAIELGGFTARIEAAYGTDRLLPRTTSDLLTVSNLVRVVGGRAQPIAARLLMGKRVPIDLGPMFVARDTVQWGAGVDYHYRGWTPLFQVNQTIVRDNHTTLLISDVDTQLFFVLRKNFLAERLATETGVLQELERGYTSGITRVTYTVTDHLRVRFGYLLIAGTRRSLIGQFHANDEAFLQLRYSY